jgi:hypothetical protein
LREFGRFLELPVFQLSSVLEASIFLDKRGIKNRTRL